MSVFQPMTLGKLRLQLIYLDSSAHRVDSRAAKIDGEFHWEDKLSQERIGKVRELNTIAQLRGQAMAQLAISWVLRRQTVTSALIGASKKNHIDEAIAASKNTKFTESELSSIECILAG